jgi:hypothetical protein
MLSPFVSQKLGLFASKESGEDLVVLKELIEAGVVLHPPGTTCVGSCGRENACRL